MPKSCMSCRYSLEMGIEWNKTWYCYHPRVTHNKFWVPCNSARHFIEGYCGPEATFYIDKEDKKNVQR